MLTSSCFGNLCIKFKKSIFYSRKCILCLAIYNCLLFAIFSAIQVRKHIFPCEVSNSTILKQHHVFRIRIEEHLYNSSQNEVIPADSHLRKWFQPVRDAYVYSAFVDRHLNSSHFIKFIGAVLDEKEFFESFSQHVKCAFKYPGGQVVHHGFSYLEKVPESHGKKYTAALFMCSLPGERQHSFPEYASMYESLTSSILWIPVNTLKRNVSNDISMSLCIRPIYGSLSSAFFAEFLAYYSIMGIDHFFLYHYNTSRTLNSFIHLSKNANVSIEVLYWDIPLDNDNIHEYGQIVFTQDCIARSRFAYTHSLIVDVDEFLVPKNRDNMKTVVAELDRQHKDAGSYVVQNVFFCDEFPVHEYAPLHILMYRYRQKTPWPHWYRSKYIFKPERILQGGVHQVWKYEAGSKEVWLSSDFALLHHYRPCCGTQQTWFFHLLSFSVLEDNIVADNTIVDMQKEIYNHSVIKFILN